MSAYRRPKASNYINYEPSSHFKLYQICLFFPIHIAATSIHCIWPVQHYCNGKIPIPSGKSLYVFFFSFAECTYTATQIPNTVRSPVLEASVPDTIIIKLLFGKVKFKGNWRHISSNWTYSMSPFFYNICESNLQKYFILYKEYKLYKFVCPSFPPYYCASFEILYNKLGCVCYISLWKDISQYCCSF